MQAAALPENETERLIALRQLDLLDTEQDEAFDQITELAAEICEVPIALVSLVDHSRQWFKSCVGLDIHETARNVSFCAHAILQPGLFIVPDTLTDTRFSDNPLVTGHPHIRFYAGSPLFTEDGLGLGTLCVIDRLPRNLTQRQAKALSVLRTHVLKLLELRRKNRELSETHRELESFSYTVSHDLRAPLRAISGFSTTLLEEHSHLMGPEARNLVKRIRDASNRMNQLTLDLLQLAQLSKSKVQFQAVNLSELAQEIITTLQKLEPERAVKVTIQPNLAAAGDAGLLHVVMENLLNNAWKFTSKTKQAEIEVGIDRKFDSTSFFVRDNGAGFEMAYAGKLFQPFQRLHTISAFPGTGVGLATVKRIITKHGGTIRAESEPNKGTIFYFTLPTSQTSAQMTHVEEIQND